MVLLGAHLDRQQIAAVDSVLSLHLGPVCLSALPLSERRTAADPATLKRALEARDALLDAGTFIAIRWGSVVDSPAAAREKTASKLDSWRATLERLQGMVEMTFKTGGSGAGNVRPDYRRMTSGAEYLRNLSELRRSIVIDESLLDEATELFRPVVEETRRQRRPDGGAEIALLVRRDRLEDVANSGRTLRHRRPDAPFLLSGPWPLEVFAE